MGHVLAVEQRAALGRGLRRRRTRRRRRAARRSPARPGGTRRPRRRSARSRRGRCRAGRARGRRSRQRGPQRLGRGEPLAWHEPVRVVGEQDPRLDRRRSTRAASAASAVADTGNRRRAAAPSTSSGRPAPTSSCSANAPGPHARRGRRPRRPTPTGARARRAPVPAVRALARARRGRGARPGRTPGTKSTHEGVLAAMPEGGELVGAEEEPEVVGEDRAGGRRAAASPRAQRAGGRVARTRCPADEPEQREVVRPHEAEQPSRARCPARGPRGAGSQAKHHSAQARSAVPAAKCGFARTSRYGKAATERSRQRRAGRSVASKSRPPRPPPRSTSSSAGEAVRARDTRRRRQPALGRGRPARAWRRRAKSAVGEERAPPERRREPARRPTTRGSRARAARPPASSSLLRKRKRAVLGLLRVRGVVVDVVDPVERAGEGAAGRGREGGPRVRAPRPTRSAAAQASSTARVRDTRDANMRARHGHGGSRRSRWRSPPSRGSSPGPLFAGRVLYFRDVGVTYYPDLVFVSRSLARGVWPLWHPGADAGAPFLVRLPRAPAAPGLARRAARRARALAAAARAPRDRSARSLLARRLGTTATGRCRLGDGLRPLRPDARLGALPGVPRRRVGPARGRAVPVARGPAAVAAEAAALGARPRARGVDARRRGPSADRHRRAGARVATAEPALAAGARRGRSASPSCSRRPALLGSARAALRHGARAAASRPTSRMSYSAPPRGARSRRCCPRFLGDTHTFSDVGFWGQAVLPRRQPVLPEPVPRARSSSCSPRAPAGASGGCGRSRRPASSSRSAPTARSVRCSPRRWAPLRGPVKFFLLTTLGRRAAVPGAGVDRAARGAARGGALVPGLLLLAARGARRARGPAPSPMPLANAVPGAAAPALVRDVVADGCGRSSSRPRAPPRSAPGSVALAQRRAARALAGAARRRSTSLRVNGGLNPTAPADFYELRPPGCRPSSPRRRRRAATAGSRTGRPTRSALTWRPEVARTDVGRLALLRRPPGALAAHAGDRRPRGRIRRRPHGPRAGRRRARGGGGASQLSTAASAAAAAGERALGALSFDPVPDDRLALRRDAFPEVREPLRLYEVRGRCRGPSSSQPRGRAVRGGGARRIAESFDPRRPYCSRRARPRPSAGTERRPGAPARSRRRPAPGRLRAAWTRTRSASRPGRRRASWWSSTATIRTGRRRTKSAPRFPFSAPTAGIVPSRPAGGATSSPSGTAPVAGAGTGGDGSWAGRGRPRPARPAVCPNSPQRGHAAC